jgi:hypothetical protein
MQGNIQTKYLTLGSRRPVTPEQGDIIATGLQGKQFSRLDITGLRFEDNGAFEQIASACVGVEDLEVDCETNSQFTALAALALHSLQSVLCSTGIKTKTSSSKTK